MATDIVIEDLDAGSHQSVRINGPSASFRLGTERITAAAVASLSPEIEDLLTVACAVFVADGSHTRGGLTRPNMGAAWRRNFGFTVPVNNPDLWSRPSVVETLTSLVEFMTEDRVTFRFVPSEPQASAQGFLDLDPRASTFRAEEVILFSGGLDSLAGALDALSSSSRKVLLVSHRSAQKVMPRQDRLAASLGRMFPGRLRHIKVEARRAGTESTETTQRSRSLLFAAIGQAVAKAFGASKLSFYENGVVSHNLPISPQVVGAMATRTTHPLVIRRLGDLMRLVVPDAVAVENPYAWLTKTEVVQRIDQSSGRDLIRQAVSCTSVREQTVLHPHCGTCSQCIDRRFAVLAAGLGDADPEEGYATDVLTGARPADHSRTMAVDWTQHARKMRDLGELDLVGSYGVELSRIVDGHPELDPKEVLRRTLALYRRHGGAVSGVLTEVIRQQAPALAVGTIASSSLLRMTVGLGPTEAAINEVLAESHPGARSVVLPRDMKEGDLVLDPDGPLEVSFFEEGGSPVVRVKGLAVLTGRKAKVPHILKPYFDVDRAAGRVPAEHRYVLVARIPGVNKSKDVIRRWVTECRNELRTAHELTFGRPPSRHLLVQNMPKKGYRLDPGISISERKS